MNGRCRPVNRKIAMCSAAVNLAAVLLFAVSMLLGFDAGSYFSSMWIAFSFVPMLCAYAHFSERKYKLAGYVAAAFAAMYAAIVLLVYFAQLTTVRLTDLSGQAAALLDFQQFGLLFHYDLLGYAVMSLATFFAGWTVHVQRKADKWLKYLLLVHGVFFLSCLIFPMLGLFRADSPAWIGVVVLEFWCAYFCPVSALSFLHFRRCRE